jgi:hypothetical protein
MHYRKIIGIIRLIAIFTTCHKAYKHQLSIVKSVSTLQKTKNESKDESMVLIASSVLIYFISYFFIFIYENRMKTITLDHTTALISLIPTMIFLAAILFFLRIIR